MVLPNIRPCSRNLALISSRLLRPSCGSPNSSASVFATRSRTVWIVLFCKELQARMLSPRTTAAVVSVKLV